MSASAKTGRRLATASDPAAPRPCSVEALKAFVQVAPIAVALTDRQLRFLAVSPTWHDDLASSNDVLIGRTSYEAVPSTRKYEAEHRRVLAGECVTGAPERLILPNGEERWMNWNASPWRDEHGRIGGILIVSHNVTAQVEAEDEARRSRALAGMIMENSPLALMVKDEAGRVLMMNRAMETLFGLSPGEHTGRLTSEVVGEDEARRLAEQDRAALACAGPVVREETISLPGRDNPRILRRTKAAIRDGRGAAYVLVIVEDVTNARRTQKELERTRAFLETVIDNLPAGLTVKDASSGRLLISNQAAGRLYGLGGADANLGRTHEEVFPPDLAARFSEQDREVIESGAARLFEEEAVPTPEGLRYLNQRKVLIRNGDGPDYLLSISEDVTERRQALHELKRTRAFLETVIDSMPAGVTVKDASTGRLLMTNPAAEAVFGFKRGEHIGKTNRDVFGAEQAASFSDQDRAAMAADGPVVFDDVPVETRTGRKFLRRTKVLARNSEGPDYLLSISEDVTGRKLARDTLKEALARAEAASVAKSEFLANMSHEIRTPLNGVLGLADALSRMELSERQREIVGMIVSSGRALTAILSDVLDLAKAEAGQLELAEESFSLSETIGEAAFLFEAVAAGKGVGFRVDFERGGPDRLLGDPLRIKQVVSNLISNAVKFTSEGEVVVGVRTTEDGGGRARLEVTVRDTGPGFSEAVRAKLFSRFEQGDGSITRRYGGTGLGLSIAVALAQMMDGEIDCSAVPGQGATFVFRARLAIETSAPLASAPRDTAPARLPGRLRILLAEDHEVNQRVVQLMLADAADLVVVPDGRQAVDAVLGPEGFDVVLMDTQMPVMDGLTAIRRIREIEARAGCGPTPIISLTANAMSHQVQASLDAGATGHLAKPITVDQLYAAIEQALAPAAQQAGAA